MACNDEDERELRLIAAMIDELSRVDVRDRPVASTSVMRPAYWRAPRRDPRAGACGQPRGNAGADAGRSSRRTGTQAMA
ncbi:hypothetical protein [Burkholderia ubonensis]|uniref:hypothetical protein n=1 Tax=Burkholderia ubonensis TaxID=101571 RepID=UPI000A6C9BFD|nr:hypothetical protein [Burkholderia ubonensis]